MGAFSVNGFVSCCVSMKYDFFDFLCIDEGSDVMIGILFEDCANSPVSGDAMTRKDVDAGDWSCRLYFLVGEGDMTPDGIGADSAPAHLPGGGDASLCFNHTFTGGKKVCMSV